MAKWGRNPAGNPRFLPAEQMPIGHPVYEMGLTDPNTTPGGIPSGSQMSIRRSSDVFPSTGAVSTPTPTGPSSDPRPGQGMSRTITTGPSSDPRPGEGGITSGYTSDPRPGQGNFRNPLIDTNVNISSGPSGDPRPGQGGGFSNFTANLNNGSRTGDVRNPLIDTNNAEAIRIQNEIDTANALAEARARAAAEAEAQAIANAEAQAELDRINAANAAAAEVASGSSGINTANIGGGGVDEGGMAGGFGAGTGNIGQGQGGFSGYAGGTGPESDPNYYAGAGGTLAGAGGAGRFSPVFGEFSPQQQYSSIMSTELPNYYMPGYQQMSQRQFQPTYGRFLLGGYGAGGTGTADQASAEQQRQNYMQTFGDWYSQQDRTAPTNLQGGWNLATQLAGMQPGSEGYYRAALQRDALPLAESLQNAEDVQAMALARYYGGATPQSSYAARQTERALGNLFGRFSNRQMQQGQTSPASFVSYLSDMSPSRFGAYA